ncbi:MAG: FecR domain-containing protein [Anaerohalosphaera sp.]|nr:FecR domain-containing protein [Anaerohalosphaera sp.]
MTSSNDIFVELRQLVTEATQGFITKERMARLNQILADSGEARRYYLELVDIFVLTEHLCSDAVFFLNDNEFDLSETQSQDLLLLELAKEEKRAPSIYVEKPEAKAVEPKLTKIVKTERKISKLAIYSLTVSAAAILLLMVFFMSIPVRPVVGVLTDSIGAEWISNEYIPAKWDVVRRGELTLAKGLAEITFNDGAVVTVEGPAIIELESPKSMFLASGRISAVVSEYATGFEVNTLSARIIDLGTEFGVSIGGDGSCSLHMFKGKANLIAGKKDQKKTSKTINANEARNVDWATGKVEEIKLGENSFVRHIDSEKGLIWRGQNVDLANIFGGGDGFKGGGKRSIDPATGEASLAAKSVDRKGSNKYQPLDEMQYIDGIFVPDGGGGAVVVDTSGNVFEKCPDTSGFYNIDATNDKWGTSGQGDVTINHGRQDDAAVLFLHSNIGITFDLDEIRTIVPCEDITAFTAHCGIPKTLVSHNNWYSRRADLDARVDFWILVDGEIRLKKLNVAFESDIIDVNIPLSAADQMLTLVVTDCGKPPIGKRATHFDWFVISEPELKIGI